MLCSPVRISKRFYLTHFTTEKKTLEESLISSSRSDCHLYPIRLLQRELKLSVYMSEEDVDDVHRFLNGNENSLRMEDEGLFSIFFSKDEESKNARLHYSKRERLQHWIRINCSIPFFVTWICASILFVVGLCYFLFSEEYVYKLSGKCDVSRIPRSVTRLIIPDKKCNTRDLYSFKLRGFEELKSIVIGNNCFVMTSLFRIEKLPKLVSIVVGDNSFDTTGEAKYFTVVHNPLLETIQIGKNSFSHFSEFQLSGNDYKNE